MRNCKSLFILLVIAALALLPAGCQAPAAAGDSIALTNCRLIDGTGNPPVDGATVLIEGGKIAKAAPGGSVTVPAGAKVIDMKGATVLPGFINAHVHRAYDEQNLKSWLSGGVTTVRDQAPFNTGNFLADRDRLNRDYKNATIVSATPILTVPDGYGTPSFTTADDAKQAVERYIGQGVDIVKFSIEDDLQGRTWKLPTMEEIKAVVDAAHAGKRKVSVHISRARNLQAAVDAGVDDIAHMVVEPIDDTLLQEIVKAGIYWEPTLELWHGVSETYGAAWVDVPLENLTKFYNAGGKVAFGTDFAGYTCTFDKGFPITEARLMKQAGMSNMDIIVAGTKNAAYVCDRADSLGTVEAGKIADLLVVKGDPLKDLDALLDVRMVVHNGKIVVDKQ